MRRRDFLLSGSALAVSGCSAAPPPAQLAGDSKVALRILFSGSVVFLPREGQKLNHVALMDHMNAHVGRLILHADDVASGGSTPTREEFGRWRLPYTSINTYAEYRYWDLTGKFSIDATSTMPFTADWSGNPKIVPMKTLGGPAVLTNWERHAKSHTTLTFGTLALATAKDSSEKHDEADWEFKDDDGNAAGSTARLTDVVALRAETSAQPTFVVKSGDGADVQIATKSAEVTAWIIQVLRELPMKPDKKVADHCRSYFAFASNASAKAKPKIPRRVTPLLAPSPSESGNREQPSLTLTIDPIFCPPGTYEL